MQIQFGIVVAATALLALAGAAVAQAQGDALPDGPGKEVVLRVCTGCHDAAQFAQARMTPQEWDNEIAKMQSAGAYMTAEEQVAISAYLAKHLSPAADPPSSEPAPPPAPAEPGR